MDNINSMFDVLSGQSTSRAALVITAILPAGLLWIKGMSWFPSFRLPFLDPTPVEEQLRKRIHDHNAAIKMKLGSVADAEPKKGIKRQRSLHAFDRPPFDVRMELDTPPQSDAESSPDKPKPQVLVPLPRNQSLPQLKLSPAPKPLVDLSAIHKQEALHFLLASLSQEDSGRIALRSFLSRTEIVAPHLLDPYLLGLDMPVNTVMMMPRNGSKWVRLERSLRTFLSEFDFMIRFNDQSVFLKITKDQVQVALRTIEETLDKELLKYVNRKMDQEVSRSVVLRDLHTELTNLVPYCVSNKFVTATVFREYLVKKGFEVDQNDVVRAKAKTTPAVPQPAAAGSVTPLRRPRLKPAPSAESSKEHVSQPTASSSGEAAESQQKDQSAEQAAAVTEESGRQPPKKSCLKKSVSFSDVQVTQSDAPCDKEPPEVYLHGPDCLCGKVSFATVARRMPAARLRSIFADRFDCLFHQFFNMTHKNASRGE